MELQLTSVQVVGDLWERFVKLLDDGVDDGYVEHDPARCDIWKTR